jgi:hypothetical protein
LHAKRSRYVPKSEPVNALSGDQALEFNDGGSVIGFPAAPRQIGATFSYRWQ